MRSGIGVSFRVGGLLALAITRVAAASAIALFWSLYPVCFACFISGHMYINTIFFFALNPATMKPRKNKPCATMHMLKLGHFLHSQRVSHPVKGPDTLAFYPQNQGISSDDSMSR